MMEALQEGFMIVECVQCHTKFKVADDKVTPTGVKVRCSKCKYVFLVKRGDAPAVESKPAASSLPLPPPPLPPVGRQEPAAVQMGLDAIPYDIFAAPTRVGPPPPGMAPQFGQSLVDEIDLDSDVPVPGKPPSKPATPLATPARQGAFPPPAPRPTASIPVKPSPIPPPPVPAPKLPPAPQPGSSKRAAPVHPPAPAVAPTPVAPKAVAPPQVPPRPPIPAGTPTPAIPQVPPRPQVAPAASARTTAVPPAALEPPVPARAVPVSKPAPVVSSHVPLGDDLFGALGAEETEGAAAAPVSGGKGVPADPFFDFPARPAAVAASQPAEIPDDPFADLARSDVLSRPSSPAVEKPVAAGDPFVGLDLGPVFSAKPAPPPAAANDDPFGDIEMVGPAQASPSPPARGPAGAAPSNDLFDNLGDPFAGITAGPPPGAKPATAMPGSKAGLAPSTAAGTAEDLFPTEPVPPSSLPAAGAKASAAGGDPFADLDTSSSPWQEHNAQVDEMVGHDPFAGLGGGSTPQQGGEEELGLALDADGKLTGRDLPPAPPPTKQLPEQPMPAESRPMPVFVAPPPMMPSISEVAPAAGIVWLYKVGFGVLLVVVVLFLFIIYRSGGNGLAKWSTYVEAFTGEPSPKDVPTDLVAARVSSTAYNNLHGRPLVVLWGEVENPTRQAKGKVAVTGQLLSANREVLAEFTAPAGIDFGPEEIYQMSDRRAVEEAYRARLPKVSGLEIPPGKTMPFMVVLYDHPVLPDDTRIRVLPRVSDQPWFGLPAPENEPTTESDPNKAVEPSGGPSPGTSPTGVKPTVDTKKAPGEMTNTAPPQPQPKPVARVPAAGKVPPAPPPAPPKGTPPPGVREERKGNFVRLKPPEEDAPEPLP